MGEECCWSTECGQGRGCEAPKETNVGEVKCGNESITTPRALLDDDGYSDKITSILSILHVKSIIISKIVVRIIGVISSDMMNHS